MNASFEITRHDLAALIEFHQGTSPVARKQKLGCFAIALAGLLMLPVGIVLTSAPPRLQTAINIWPLFLGPILFALFAMPYMRWQTRQMSNRLLREGKNSRFYGHCELTIDSDGLTETRPSGVTTRKWSAVERVAVTPQHLFIFTSGTEAYVVPRLAFQTEAEFTTFVERITEHAGVAVDGRGWSTPSPKTVGQARIAGHPRTPSTPSAAD